MTIYGNVVPATHGETKTEVLGSGDASQPYQSFTLRQKPLTYVSAPTPSGAESTLKVRVNEVLWHEVASLYGAKPRDRVFTTRTDDDGKTTLQFGDGKTGARPPSGQENITATYRISIGLDGLVNANQLSLLTTRALGVKGVVNPLPATGAENPESLEQARQNAPLTVLILERIVSLQDYQDFARAFAGIAKALATWTWNGQSRGVFVTIAGPNGAEISANSDVYKNLIASMRRFSDPHVPLQVQSYRRAFFRLQANVKIDPDYLPERVLSAIEQAVRSRFSFDVRDFGQPVVLSDVVATIQSVLGVVAVDVDQLHRLDEPPTRRDRLIAQAPRPGDNQTTLAAELLLLAPAPLDVQIISTG
ncbi:MAG: putative baseplate assembly protein [Leptolyngbyaceae cyanobacterium RU_5_1]|nr:putative baseplate assembly protein [Leptolyngbyaceae cyanobacterium RU_5_1]